MKSKVIALSELSLLGLNLNRMPFYSTFFLLLEIRFLEAWDHHTLQYPNWHFKKFGHLIRRLDGKLEKRVKTPLATKFPNTSSKMSCEPPPFYHFRFRYLKFVKLTRDFALWAEYFVWNTYFSFLGFTSKGFKNFRIGTNI